MIVSGVNGKIQIAQLHAELVKKFEDGMLEFQQMLRLVVLATTHSKKQYDATL